MSVTISTMQASRNLPCDILLPSSSSVPNGQITSARVGITHRSSEAFPDKIKLVLHATGVWSTDGECILSGHEHHRDLCKVLMEGAGGVAVWDAGVGSNGVLEILSTSEVLVDGVSGFMLLWWCVC